MQEKKLKDGHFSGVDILVTSPDSGLRTLRILNEFEASDLHLLISNNNSKDYNETLKLNLQRNKMEERLSQKLFGKWKHFKKKLRSIISLVQNKEENEMLLLSYLNLFNPKNDSPCLRYDIIDINCSDSLGLKTIKSAMNSIKKKGGS